MMVGAPQLQPLDFNLPDPLEAFTQFISNPNTPDPAIENLLNGFRRTSTKDLGVDDDSKSEETVGAPVPTEPTILGAPGPVTDSGPVEVPAEFKDRQNDDQQSENSEPADSIVSASNPSAARPLFVQNCRCNPPDLDKLYQKIDGALKTASDNVGTIIKDFKEKVKCTDVNCGHRKMVQQDPYLAKMCHLEHRENGRSGHLMAPEPSPLTYQKFIGTLTNPTSNPSTLVAAKPSGPKVAAPAPSSDNHHEERESLLKQLYQHIDDFKKNYQEPVIQPNHVGAVQGSEVQEQKFPALPTFDQLFNLFNQNKNVGF
jgi:hypothetical protein